MSLLNDLLCVDLENIEYQAGNWELRTRYINTSFAIKTIKTIAIKTQPFEFQNLYKI